MKSEDHIKVAEAHLEVEAEDQESFGIEDFLYVISHSLLAIAKMMQEKHR